MGNSCGGDRDGNPGETLDIDEITERTSLIRTGDIVLYHTLHFVPHVQRLFTHSKYDHVGIFVRAPRGLYTLEADGSGINLYPFTKKSLTSYPGSYVIRKLEGCPTGEGEQIAEKLKAFAREIHGRPYNHNLMEMVHAAGIMGDNKKCDPSSLFCSELVAESLKHMGLMGSERLSNMYIPGDFAEAANDERKVRLLNGCFYGPEIKVSLDHIRGPLPHVKIPDDAWGDYSHMGHHTEGPSTGFDDSKWEREEGGHAQFAAHLTQIHLNSLHENDLHPHRLRLHGRGGDD